MVLGLGDQDLVAFLQVDSGVAACHQVDGCRGAAGEDHLVGGRSDEGCSCFTALLIQVGGIQGQAVHGAVHVGAGLGVHFLQHLDDAVRLLAGGRIVEIDQRLAIDLLCECRETASEVGCSFVHHSGVRQVLP